jgi:Cof subfamily protein (haloacid dehalogenase superfamily)
MLFAFDLDKTLVTNDFELPNDTLDAIELVRMQGHLVTVLTGRPHAAAKPFLERLGVRGTYSVNHGALVYGADGRLARQRRIPADTVRAMLSPYETSGRDVAYACIVDDTLYVREPDHDKWSWAHTESRSVAKLDLAESRDTDKIVFLANGESPALEREIRTRLPDAITYLWEDGFLEVTSPDSDKGKALAYIAETLGVAREDTIAFGDGLNDVTMLAWAGYSVAVGPHVHADTLAQADEHVASPEEGGVAGWLRAHWL